jgi:uncharacterized protein
MVVGTLQLKLHFPDPQSLKEKRCILKSLLTRFSQAFNAGIAELDGMDLWQYSVLGVVCVARERKEAEKLINHIRHFFDHENGCRVIEDQQELL